jgi:cephalosporin-C deacetylase-like acetyl esterase
MDPASEWTNLENAQTAMAYWLWEINESLFGMRVQDVIRGVDYAFSRPDVNRSGVRLIGRGEGALWALFAAALDSRILATVCDRGLLSYRSLTQGDRYQYSADIIIPDVLNHFDLPQVAAAVAPRSLALLAPLDPMMNSVAVDVARSAYHWTEAAYRAAASPGRFRVAAPGGEGNRVDRYLELLS